MSTQHMNTQQTINTTESARLVPSILDRLLGETNQKDRQPGTYGDRLMRECVRRDLESLLNSKFRNRSIPAQYTEANRSVLNYGLPDLSTINMNNPATRQQLCRTLEHIIRQFEPRFKQVRVTTDSEPYKTNSAFRFQIDAVLYANPAPERIFFDSSLEPLSRNINVKESSL